MIPGPIRTALRAVLLGSTGLLILFDVMPAHLQGPVVDHSVDLLGGVLVLWCAFAGRRAMEKAKHERSTEGS